MPALIPYPTGTRSVRLLGAAVVLCATAACSGGSASTPSTPDPPTGLPTRPEIVSPIDGSQEATDMPTLTVRNAAGYDAGQAEYTFRVTSASGAVELYSATVPAGSGQTAHTVVSALPRGMLLAWSAVARTAASESASAVARFRGPAVECLSGGDPYAKAVVDWHIPECSLAQNIYNDPTQVLGSPNSLGRGPAGFTGIVSLGEGGYVTVDMELCAVDLAGPDVRVFQRASSEPVTLYAAGRPEGPFILLEARKPCGEPSEGTRSGQCSFDLAGGEVETARYFRIEDGELYPCPGTTVTEGADIDAIEIVNMGGQ